MENINVKFKDVEVEVPVCESLGDIDDSFELAISEFLNEGLDLNGFLELFDRVPYEDLNDESNVQTKYFDFLNDELCFSVQKIPVKEINYGEPGGLFNADRAYIIDSNGEVFALDCKYEED